MTAESFESRLARLKSVTERLYGHESHNPLAYLERSREYYGLEFFDLSAADAYRALILLESAMEGDLAEYTGLIPQNEGDKTSRIVCEDDYVHHAPSAMDLLIRALLACGCVRDAVEFARRQHVRDDTRRRLQGELDMASRGRARRIQYPWNTHEPDRTAPETVDALNAAMAHIAPRCEVRAVRLPLLLDGAVGKGESVQLGVFAKEYLPAGQVILEEKSMLTATNRMHDSLCDACHAELPDITDETAPVACPECLDVYFCSQACYVAAEATYHRAICGCEDFSTVGKDITDPNDSADALYLLLLARAMAMAETRDLHPLELPEVKYIWGDFHPNDPCVRGGASDMLKDTRCETTGGPTRAPFKSETLPFSFHLNILQPMRVMEAMELDPFASLSRYDTWVINTMYAKFRGTASGRLSTWDGAPEVCAVHPFWCLANHSCSPNVRWQWSADIRFIVRDTRIGPEGQEEATSGIRQGEEILGHYCDISLPLKERREWAAGALGGPCQCSRCMAEERISTQSS